MIRIGKIYYLVNFGNKARIKVVTNKYMEDTAMTNSAEHDRPSGNPTEWTVTARRWTLKYSEQEIATGEDTKRSEARTASSLSRSRIIFSTNTPMRLSAK
jgi:hypothetical protein